MTRFLFVKRTLWFLLLTANFFPFVSSMAQTATNSVFVNFGRRDCSGSFYGSDITLFADAQTTNPDLLLQCNTDATMGTIFSKFISFNATNNKLYMNNIGDGTNSVIYILNISIPSNVSCPSVSPSYTISNVVLSQFEFDPLGDLYALSNYDNTLGTANLGAYDDTTGILQSGSLKTLLFPSGHFPTDVGNGDIAIAPNGRMFCIFGGDTSRLYEIVNYQKALSGNAVATYLGATSKVCYGIAYDNGYLLMGGSDFGGTCYSFNYNLSTNVLSGENSSPLDAMIIDATSFSPSIAVGNQLVSATQIDATHYDLTYQIYVKNL